MLDTPTVVTALASLWASLKSRSNSDSNEPSVPEAKQAALEQPDST